MQKSQNGGGNPILSGPSSSTYHLWAVAPAAKASAEPSAAGKTDADLFHNSKVNVDTSIAGLARLVPGEAPAWLTTNLRDIDEGLRRFETARQGQQGAAVAHKLAPIYRQTLDLYKQVEQSNQVGQSNLDAQAKAGLLLELGAKIEQFQGALKELLGLDLMAFTAKSAGSAGGGPFRANSAMKCHAALRRAGSSVYESTRPKRPPEASLSRVWLESHSGDSWKAEPAAGASADQTFVVHAAENAEPTAPFFTRPSIEQPYYDVARPEWRERSFAPYPLAAWAEFAFDGVPIRLGQDVQTLARVPGPGGIYEPLVVTPAIGVRIAPEARILPLDGSALPVRVTVHTEAAADGTLKLKLPAGWRATPRRRSFTKRAPAIPSRSSSPSRRTLSRPAPIACRWWRSPAGGLTRPVGRAWAMPGCDRTTFTSPPN